MNMNRGDSGTHRANTAGVTEAPPNMTQQNSSCKKEGPTQPAICSQGQNRREGGWEEIGPQEGLQEEPIREEGVCNEQSRRDWDKRRINPKEEEYKDFEQRLEASHGISPIKENHEELGLVERGHQEPNGCKEGVDGPNKEDGLGEALGPPPNPKFSPLLGGNRDTSGQEKATSVGDLGSKSIGTPSTPQISPVFSQNSLSRNTSGQEEGHNVEDVGSESIGPPQTPKTSPVNGANKLCGDTSWGEDERAGPSGKNGGSESLDPPPTPKTSPVLTASWLSRITWWWQSPLLRQGYRKPLDDGDIYEVLPSHNSQTLCATLQRRLDTGESKSKWALAKALFFSFRQEILLNGFIAFFVEALKLIQPVLVGWLVSHLELRNLGADAEPAQEGPGSLDLRSPTTAWVIASVLVLVSFIYSIPYAATFHGQCVVALKARVACTALVYRKVIKMSLSSLAERSHGEVVNLISTDVEKFNLGVLWLHYTWLAPVEILVLVVLLYHEVGVASLAGVAVITLLVSLQQLVACVIGRTRLKVASSSDERVNKMSEIIHGITTIKMLNWEKPMAERVASIRRRELKEMWKTQTLRGQNNSLFFIAGKVTLFFIILTLTFQHQVLTLASILRTLAWLEMARVAIFFFLPEAFSHGLEMLASISRLQEFLLLEDQDELGNRNHGDSVKQLKDTNLKNSVEENSLTDSSHNITAGSFSITKAEMDYAVRMEQVSSSWDKKSNKEHSEINSITPSSSKENHNFQLSDLSIDIKKGELVAIVGGIASGKIAISQGKMEVVGPVSYSPQEPWVFAASVKDNILFGDPQPDLERYTQVVKACGLNQDLLEMQEGENTMVGERGLKLSGGQRARVSFARAVYREANVYLLDDPFSMVDAEVANEIFRSCIMGLALNSTRIIVTNHIQHLRFVDRIILLEKGRVKLEGSYESLQGDPAVMSVMKPVVVDQDSTGLCRRKSSSICSVIDMSSLSNNKHGQEGIKQAKNKVKEVSFPAKGYWSYFLSGYGHALLVVYVIWAVATQACYILADWWLSKRLTLASDDARNSTLSYHNNTMDSAVSSNRYLDFLPMYSALTFVLVAVSALKEITLNIFTTLASYVLHGQLCHNTMSATLKFFQATSAGDVLNRFSRDLGFIDDLLPHTLRQVLNFFFILSGVAVLAIVINPWVVLVLIPVVIISVVLQRYSIRTTTRLKRIEAEARTPLFSQLSSTLDGLSVIRAFAKGDCQLKQFHAAQNHHTSAWYLYLSCYRWLGMRLDWLTSVFLAGVIIAALLIPNIDSGLLGMTLTYIIISVGLLQFLVRESAQLDSQMISVERVKAYRPLEEEMKEDQGTDIDLLKENSKESQDVKTKMSFTNSAFQDTEIISRENNTNLNADNGASFYIQSVHPSRVSLSNIEGFSSGEITFDSMSLLYEEKVWAVRDVTATIHHGEKIGIVGRTGAGKSSLFSCLLRLWPYKGHVTIGGHDIQNLSLSTLRRNISVVPQDPVLFSGAIRDNLDLCGSHTDQDIWEVLDKVHLQDKIAELPGGLSSSVGEGCCELSAGERQQMCLARALLANNNILLLDEATANIDYGTENLIKSTIKKRFQHCTVLTIAHRLQNVLGCDRVMVFKGGRLVEMDHPEVLLRDPESKFYHMYTHLNTE